MKTTLLFTLLILSVFLSYGQGTGEVIITEIHNRPSKPSQELLDAALLLAENSGFSGDTSPNEGHTEWFEIYNTTGAPVVMDNWTLTDGSSSSKITTIGSFTLGANEYAIFSGFHIPDAQGGIAPDYIYDYKEPSFNNESTYSGGSTSNCPDGIIIKKGDGTLVDQVLYDYGYGSYIVGGVSNCSNNPGTTSYGFPGMSGSSKTSFMLKAGAPITSAANDMASNWEYSTLTYDGDQKGTPGTANNVDATLSNENFIFSNFKIYPNPAKDFITIKSNDFKINSVEMFSVLGEKLLSKTNITNNLLRVSQFNAGIYLLKINAKDGSLIKKIIIK